MKVLMLVCVVVTLFTQGLGAPAYTIVAKGTSAIQKAKLEDTVELDLGAGVKDVQFGAIDPQGKMENYEYIVKDEKITKYAKQKYGDRLSFSNGILTIKNLKKKDAMGGYFFNVGGKVNEKMVIAIQLTS